jgi:hypothetical protein
MHVQGGVTSEASMGIPPGETPLPSPLPSSERVVSSAAPLLSSTASTTTTTTSSRGSRVVPSASGSAPAQQSTSAASASASIALDNGAAFNIAWTVSSLALVGAALLL